MIGRDSFQSSFGYGLLGVAHEVGAGVRRFMVVAPRAAVVRRRMTTRAGSLTRDKLAIQVACEEFIERILKPRFLPEIHPSDFNCPIDIYGKCHGTKYRFVQRYRTGRSNPIVEEFDAPFAGVDLSYHRHRGGGGVAIEAVPSRRP
jgi:hypothetical protein